MTTESHRALNRQFGEDLAVLSKFRSLPISLLSAALIIAPFLSSCAPPPGPNGGPAGPAGPMGPAQFIIQTIYFFLLGLFVYYMLVLRPATIRNEAQRKFFQELKKNDEVITSSGIFGRVVTVADDFVTIEVAPNVRIRIKPEHLRSPIKPPVS